MPLSHNIKRIFHLDRKIRCQKIVFWAYFFLFLKAYLLNLQTLRLETRLKTKTKTLI